MTTSLCLTIRFLHDVCHGRGNHGEPEWPPSPLRAYQALVAAAAARWNEHERIVHAAHALQWLERQPPPLVVAPHAEPSRSKYRLYVPDNVGDKVAASWSHGRDASLAEYRTEKDVRPTNLPGQCAAVHYLWPIRERDFEPHRAIVLAAAQSITHLGWGVDMVVAQATVISQDEVERLEGERWRPALDRATTRCRTPTEGTFQALAQRHRAFLDRIGPEGFRPVTPLTAFRVVHYSRDSEPPGIPFAAFRLLKPNEIGFRTFDPTRSAHVVAAMLRHAASAPGVTDALGWSDEMVARFILGHGEEHGQPHVPVNGPRLAYLGIPSIEARGQGRASVVGGIRRAMLAVLGGPSERELEQLSRLLTGTDLFEEGKSEPVALIARLSNSDGMVQRYAAPQTTWATVTPVVLPGHDDPRKLRKRIAATSEIGSPSTGAHGGKGAHSLLDRRTEYLLRKAIRQAGFSEELARHAEIKWRGVGFWPGTQLASRYLVPSHHQRFRRLHMRITWRDASGAPIEVAGPICLGGGRFNGLGLFAGVRPSDLASRNGSDTSRQASAVETGGEACIE